MVVVNFNRQDLENLVGQELTKETLKNKVPMIGCECEAVTDEEVEFELFPDRPDMISVEGFARALRYFLDISKGLKKYKTKKSGIKLVRDESVKTVRPYVTGAIIKNINLDEAALKSLIQFQEKIHQTFGRKRKKVSIGIHDMQNLKPPFTYKAVPPESVEFVPLEAEAAMNLKEIRDAHPKGKYAKIVENSDNWPVITDADDKILSFPPVINSKLTQVTENTNDIFIDITGIDEKAINQSLNMLVTSFAERNSKIRTVKIDNEQKPNLEPDKIEVNLDYVNKLLDLDIKENEFKKIIEGMGFGYKKGVVYIPPYRTDIMHQIDIVEDVAIKYGYENFNPRIPDVSTIGKPDQLEEFCEELKNIFVGFGFQEVITSVLTNREKQFEWMGREEEEIISTKNPLTEKHSVCRKYLMPDILQTLNKNKHVSYPQKIFEISNVVLADTKSETGAKNVKKLAAGITDNMINYTDMASVLDVLFDLLGIEYELKPINNAMFIDSRCAQVTVKNNKIGVVGEIHPKVLENWNIEKPVVAMEMDIEKLRD